jgi:hypothetical protein
VPWKTSSVLCDVVSESVRPRQPQSKPTRVKLFGCKLEAAQGGCGMLDDRGWRQAGVRGLLDIQPSADDLSSIKTCDAVASSIEATGVISIIPMPGSEEVS